MPIIPTKEIEITDREQLAFELADIINDALTGMDKLSPQDVAERIMTAIDHSAVFVEAPKAPTLPRRPGTVLDMDAIIAADNDAA